MKTLGILALALSVVLVADAQGRTFEVSSIKRNTTARIIGDGAMSVGSQPGGRFIMEAGTALVLIRSAFPDAVDVIGGPEWASSDHYDVQAKADRAATATQMNEMLRALLAERFKFAAHYETREKPVYALMVARTDGRLGPELHHYAGDCAAYNDAVLQGREKPQLPVPANGFPMCGYTIGPSGMIAGGLAMSAMANAVKFYANRTVIDKTGLRGYYEFRLQMSQDISVFTAIREQLGLKLESDRAQLPVLVIDHVERPTED